METAIRLIWKLHRKLVWITHKSGEGSHTPRGWAARVKLGRWRLIESPWMWCSCGDSLESWQEAKRGMCHLCQDWIEDHAGD